MDERQEEDLRRRFQEKFDLRYVLKEGEYVLVRTLLFSFVGLVLTSVVVGVLALVIK